MYDICCDRPCQLSSTLIIPPAIYMVGSAHASYFTNWCFGIRHIFVIKLKWMEWTKFVKPSNFELGCNMIYFGGSLVVCLLFLI